MRAKTVWGPLNRVLPVAACVLAGCLPYYPEINDAAGDGKLAEVRRLVDAKPKLVDARDMNGDRPIHNAARKGHHEIVRLLLEKGADVNPRGRLGQTALLEAVERGHTKTIELLLSRGAQASIPDSYHRKTPLHYAARENYTPFVKMLLKAGADPNARDRYGSTPLHESAGFCHPEKAIELYRKGPELMRRLEERGLVKHEPELDEKMRRKVAELHRGHLDYLGKEYERTRHLVGTSNKKVAEMLIAAGADVNALDRWGRSPLHHAAEKGHAAMVEVLIQNGADVNAAERECGYTPLIHATKEGQSAVAEAFIKAGADVNARTQGGETALLRAVVMGHEAIVRLLLTNGAKVNTEDEEGRTPLGEATRPLDAEERAWLEAWDEGEFGRRENIAGLLREHGATE